MMHLDEFFIFFFESVALFMAGFFLMQFIILKRKEYLFYSIYLLLLTIYYLLAIPEFFFGVNLQNKQLVTQYDLFKRPVQFLISVFYSLFVIYYLGLKKIAGPLHRTFQVLMYFFVLLSVLCFVGNLSAFNYDPFYYGVSLLLFPVQLYIVIALFRYKVRYSRFIIWGSINVILGSVITLLLSLELAENPGGIISNANSYIPVMMSILLDIFLFSVALQSKIADNEKSLIDAAYQRQRAVFSERERIIADLHDDVGGGLSSIRMMSDLMTQEQQPSLGKSAHFPQKISSTAKEIAQRMNTIIWSLNTENDSLQNFTEYVRQFGVTYFENSGILFSCEVAAELPSNKELSGVQRKNLFLIIKEALHNTLKHAGASKVSVNMYAKEGRLCIDVADDGSGIKNSQNFGNGLKNMKKRMEEIDGQINFADTNGTCISISIKIDH
jgi:signal transduction histidine kinase